MTGVEWILAVGWIPYQLPTFVTPAFQGYISGHSTFSLKAAVVLTGLAGSEYFPGGVAGYTIKAGMLKFEKGPKAYIRLEWATYYDAADQIGRSRVWGGIHVAADDLMGRDAHSAATQRGPRYSSTTRVKFRKLLNDADYLAIRAGPAGR